MNQIIRLMGLRIQGAKVEAASPGSRLAPKSRSILTITIRLKIVQKEVPKLMFLNALNGLVPGVRDPQYKIP